MSADNGTARVAAILEQAGVEPPAEAEVVRFTDAASFVLDGPTEYVPLWGDQGQPVWAEGEAFWLCGPQGVTKSTVMQQLAFRRHGILDGELLGWPVNVTEGRGLYLAMDRPLQIKRSMRRMVGEQHRDLLRDRLAIWKGPPPGDLARHADLLTNLADQAGATTVYLDSLKDAAVGLSEDEVGAGFNRAVQTALAAGIEVMGTHHQRKKPQGGNKPKTLDDVYGSTWITSGAGSVVLLWGKAGDAIIDFEHLKPPGEPAGPLQFIVDFDFGTVEVEDAVDLAVLASRSRHGLTAEGAARAMYGTTEPDKNQTQRARRRLDNHPELERVEGPTPPGGGRPAVHYRIRSVTTP